MKSVADSSHKRYTIKNFVWVWKNLAPFRYDCPFCTPLSQKGKDPYSSSVSTASMWDEKYHKYKFYVHCRNPNCDYVTPAYDTAREALDHMDIDWALVEDKILLGNEA